MLLVRTSSGWRGVLKRWLVLFEFVVIALSITTLVGNGYPLWFLPWWLTAPLAIFMIIISLGHLWLMLGPRRR